MRILVVDDEPELVDLLEELLISELGASVVKAGSGSETLRLLDRDKDFDIILCDYSMADGNGGVVFNVWKHFGKPFIMISAGNTSEYPGFSDFLNNPMNREIRKPFQDEHVIQMIRALLKV